MDCDSAFGPDMNGVYK